MTGLELGGAAIADDVPLAPLTTLRIGPVARRLITCTSTEQIDSTARASEETWAPMTARDRDVLRALCRPLVDDSSGLPATNDEIAAEVGLSVDSVKARLRVQYERYGLMDMRQGEKRTRLARLLLSNGTFKPHDF